MIELLLVVLIAVISVSVYAYAYYILKFRDDTKHCPPCEPCPVPVPCPTEVDTKVDVPNYDSEITESNESVQPNDTEPTPCPANWAPVCAEGMTYGNASVSKKHANFIVNTSYATSEDISQLINLIQQKVIQKYGIMLHPEVRMIGFEYP